MTDNPSSAGIKAALHRLVIAVVVAPIRFYRRWLSPLKRVPTCRYLPTCSEYALDAVRTRGVVIGTGLAVGRIVRCHPFARGGYDPVPQRGGAEVPEARAAVRPHVCSFDHGPPAQERV